MTRRSASIALAVLEEKRQEVLDDLGRLAAT